MITVAIAAHEWSRIHVASFTIIAGAPQYYAAPIERNIDEVMQPTHRKSPVVPVFLHAYGPYLKCKVTNLGSQTHLLAGDTVATFLPQV
mmetsp:Transcript_2035/g.6384  ORF Transcript_2035/g.6384 Transcript_2035/m.6384 type:complete len:89 (+) Transcript_2035:41-307(+)|eukprot:scaffold110125_cov35-Tisochrysis_lutea.AAC.2